MRRRSPALVAAVMTMAAMLAVAAACASSLAPLPAPEPAAVATPLSPLEIETIAQLLALEDDRRFDRPMLTRAVRAESDAVRGRAALALGRIGDPQARPLLLEATRDSVDDVRADAAFALGLLGDTGVTVVNALAALLRADGAAGREAAAALGRLGAGRLHLEGVLTDSSARPALSAALLAVARLPRRESTVALVVPHTRDPDPAVRWRATYTLMRAALPATVPRLLELAEDEDAQVRQTAVRALRPETLDSAGLRERGHAILMTALDDADPHVRINAARALAALRPDASTAAAVRPLLAAAEVNVRVAATQALAATGGAEAAAALVDVLTDSTSAWALRSAALAGLLPLDGQRGLPFVARWAADDAWLTRFYAARLLADLPPADGLRLAVTLGRDADPRVRAAAIGATARVADMDGARRPFVEALGDGDALVRAAALAALAPHARASDLSLFLDAYARAERDAVPDAAVAALEALAQLQRTGTPAARSIFLRFRAPPTRAVHDAALRLFVEAEAEWGQLPPDTRRSAADYQRIVRRWIASAHNGAESPRVEIVTARGPIVIELAAAHAPLTVDNFVTLVASGFYSPPAGGRRFHRVVPNFVAQDGDPRGDGGGGPGYTIRDEINRLTYGRGTVGMALAGPDTGGSQFFITHSPQPHLDGGFAIFGEVVAGIDILDQVAQDDEILTIRLQPDAR